MTIDKRKTVNATQDGSSKLRCKIKSGACFCFRRECVVVPWYMLSCLVCSDFRLVQSMSSLDVPSFTSWSQ